MLRISGTKILLTRGDSAYITLEVFDDVENLPYSLVENDIVDVKVQVRNRCNDDSEDSLKFEASLTKGNLTLSDEADNCVVWHIEAKESRKLSVGTDYYWDAQVMTSCGTAEDNIDVFTFIPASLFRVTDEVTR